MVLAGVLNWRITYLKHNKEKDDVFLLKYQCDFKRASQTIYIQDTMFHVISYGPDISLLAVGLGG